MSSTPRGSMVLVAIVFEGGLAIAAVLLGWLLGYDPLLHLHWTWAGAGWGVAATLPMALVMLFSAHIPWRPLRELTETVQGMVHQLFKDATALDLALVATTAGLGEELLFRGFLQQMIAHWSGPWVALAVTSVLFGLMHLITPTYAVLAGLLGAYLGGLWLATDNLLAPILAHALYDFVALLYLLRTGTSEAQ